MRTARHTGWMAAMLAALLVSGCGGTSSGGSDAATTADGPSDDGSTGADPGLDPGPGDAATEEGTVADVPDAAEDPAPDSAGETLPPGDPGVDVDAGPDDVPAETAEPPAGCCSVDEDCNADPGTWGARFCFRKEGHAFGRCYYHKKVMTGCWGDPGCAYGTHCDGLVLTACDEADPTPGQCVTGGHCCTDGDQCSDGWCIAGFCITVGGNGCLEDGHCQTAGDVCVGFLEPDTTCDAGGTTLPVGGTCQAATSLPSASATIPAATGGSVALEGGGARVDVPAGALAADTAITLAEVPASGLPDIAGLLSPVFDFGPEGTTFAMPATITVTRTRPAPAQKTAVLAYLAGDAWVAVTGSTAVGTEVSAPVAHFSRYAVVAQNASPQYTDCVQLVACSTQGCSGSPDPDCHAKCMADATTAAQTDYVALLNCIDDICGASATDACIQTATAAAGPCATQKKACTSSTAVSTTCTQVRMCAGGCDGDATCIAACEANADAGAAALFLAMWTCVTTACPDCATSPMPAACHTCAQAASAAGGACQAQVGACT